MIYNPFKWYQNYKIALTFEKSLTDDLDNLKQHKSELIRRGAASLGRHALKSYNEIPQLVRRFLKLDKLEEVCVDLEFRNSQDFKH